MAAVAAGAGAAGAGLGFEKSSRTSEEFIVSYCLDGCGRCDAEVQLGSGRGMVGIVQQY